MFTFVHTILCSQSGLFSKLYGKFTQIFKLLQFHMMTTIIYIIYIYIYIIL